ncbi:hypothetical protein GCM10007205_23420 [Oxalicibacterium flavum]|uniref:Uncharacterized protein n=1 Tax=Oxalicibacterium flavum TaxID=179467 RepID=A0A8J2ULL5_9BURK|nr:hypothetical protein [Oxalicibacterium flavum]GGC13841.1 hypothetical protein GCM10007205_23420 [Oxalicibacterium flavum]
MFRTLLSSLKNPATMTDENLEHEWVRVKEKVLTTCADTHRQTYNVAYDRASNILTTLVNRHRHLILDAECIQPFYKFIQKRIGSQISTNVEHTSAPLLYGLTLAAYTGGSTSTSGSNFLSNPDFVMESIDYLIQQDDAMGYFLKGLVLKYGLQLFLRPNLQAAKQYLLKAQAMGVGSTKIELQQFFTHEYRLSHVDNVHMDVNNYEKWQ